ncbi:MAG: hypothetical protein A2920_00390 [Candidatus Zambryskibacteria bacterium RIFCSPLOWO2_01_FULL_43_17]|uniref:Uncharacterized protein n=1 Tax=Candidatus Zambryskibacteria bacterium RIFCSPLOWO2_01_FULL_43_17 TaxID=1802760 RepID=A0A1G2U211_9BACT|nr:MAG: hypothetical protein A2920_00390 [Candidatus Zambryskibacteria bacterium RIFCSPLOWO2_01_FULL_43_17]
MPIERTANWWQAFLEEKLSGWQLRVVIPRMRMDPITMLGMIRGVEVRATDDKLYSVTFHMPVVGFSGTMDPYEWNWSDKNPPHTFQLTEANFLQLERVDETAGGANFALQNPAVQLFLIPPSADLFLRGIPE